MISTHRKNILFISQSFPPSIGGVSSLLFHLSNLLADKGYNVHALHFETSHLGNHTLPFVYHHTISSRHLPEHVLRGYAEFKEYIYRHLHGLASFDFDGIESLNGYDEFMQCVYMFQKKLFTLMETEKIDIIHLHDYQLLPLISSQISAPIIFSLHAPLLESIHPIVFDWMYQFMKICNKVIFSIPSYTELASERGLAPSKAITLPPITREFFRHKTQAIPMPQFNKEGLLDTTVISCIQRFDAKSGHIQLIKAFAKALENNKNIHLLLVGGQSFTDTISDIRFNYYAQAKEMVKELGIFNKVTFMGNVDYIDLKSVYDVTDIVIMLSKMECYGLVISEAMSLSKPVIVTNVGGLRYQVQDEITGFVVNVDDVNQTAEAILRLTKTPLLCTSMGRMGKQRYDQFFRPEHWQNELLKVYDEIMSTTNIDLNFP